MFCDSWKIVVQLFFFSMALYGCVQVNPWKSQSSFEFCSTSAADFVCLCERNVAGGWEPRAGSCPIGKRRNVQDQGDHEVIWDVLGSCRNKNVWAVGSVPGRVTAYSIHISEQSAWFGEQPYTFNALPHSLCSPENAAPTQECSGSHSPAKGWIPLNTSPLTWTFFLRDTFLLFW